MAIEITINNFMNHKKLKLNLKGLTLITGKNGAGKSAILHALSWLVDGGSNNFITKGEDKSSVQVKLGDKVIKRVATKSTDKVIYNGKVVANNKDSLKDIGNNIELSFYNQFDKVYLLSEGPTSRAVTLNDIFEIQKLEDILAKVTKNIRDDSNSVKDKVEEMQEKKKEHSKYCKAVIGEERIREIEDTQDEWNTLKEYGSIKVVDDIPEKIGEFYYLQLLEDYNNIDTGDIPEPMTDLQLRKLKLLMEWNDTEVTDIPKKKDIDFDTIRACKEYLKTVKTIEKAKEDKEELLNIFEQLVEDLEYKNCPLCGKKIGGDEHGH